MTLVQGQRVRVLRDDSGYFNMVGVVRDEHAPLHSIRVQFESGINVLFKEYDLAPVDSKTEAWMADAAGWIERNKDQFALDCDDPTEAYNVFDTMIRTFRGQRRLGE